MSTFRFQQFSVLQQRSGMKVCTDAVLFGAMAPLHLDDRVLDIGTGTGVLALMAAQLGAAKVTGVELTQEAYEEAGINFNLSPWADRIEAVHQDIQGFALAADNQYDLIMSNPPFFANHSKTTASLRNAARHNNLLSFPDLISSADKLLTEQGLFYVLIPVPAVEKFSVLALAGGFYLVNRIDYRGYAHTKAKVSALTFSRTALGFTAKILTIYESLGAYTKESEGYLQDFLLRFSQGRQAQQ
ncbi:MAG: tRNA1(Val) (adenine(37)-N6)-methyltransferase [Methylobacter sp.]